MRAVRILSERFEVEHLLLTLTSDPVVIMLYQVRAEGFKTTVRLVHDYVNKKVGVVSLFNINMDDAVKVSIHGLGHNTHTCKSD